MLIVYIAHPIGGDVTSNMKLVEEKCKEILKYQPEIIPLAPYLLVLTVLNDANPQDRIRGIRINKEFFNRKIIDEVWLFGNRISNGMWEEILWARSKNIPIVPMTRETQIDLFKKEIRIGDLFQIGVCGPGQEDIVEYIGELQADKGVIVSNNTGIHKLPWEDIMYTVPLIAPLRSPMFERFLQYKEVS